MRWKTGDLVEARTFEDIRGGAVAVPDPQSLVHLQFRRFAGCPVCNLHLRSFTARRDEVAQAGVREVIFFHSDVHELRKYETDLPFSVVADPDKRLYREFGVEFSLRALLRPRVWGPILRGVAVSTREALRGRPIPPIFPKGGNLGLPADFLLDSAGRVLAVKYGEHAYDQWSVDELLRLARQVPAASPGAA